MSQVRQTASHTTSGNSHCLERLGLGETSRLAPTHYPTCRVGLKWVPAAFLEADLSLGQEARAWGVMGQHQLFLRGCVHNRSQRAGVS